jgi:hypothetical protein
VTSSARGSQPTSFCVEGFVCSHDEVFESIVGLELGDSNGEGCSLQRFCQFLAREREPLSGLWHGHVEEPAQELIAAEADDLVIGAKMRPDRIDCRAQQLIAGDMTA